METHKKRLIYLLLWQNLLDAKIVWNCCIIHSISFNVALVTSTLFTDYKVPMPRKNIQNFLEETCKSVHKWLLSIYLDKTTKWQGTSFFIRWVSCLLWSDQSMPRTMIPQHQSFAPNWNIPWSPYQIIILRKNRNVP